MPLDLHFSDLLSGVLSKYIALLRKETDLLQVALRLTTQYYMIFS